MTFRETLEDHIRAITARDLERLRRTVPVDGGVVLVMSDGRVVRTVREYLELHRHWFASSTWTLHVDPIQTIETDQLGLAVLRLEYRDTPESGPSTHQQSIHSLLFARREGGC